MQGLDDLLDNYSTDDFVGILWYGSTTGGIPEGNARYYWYAGDGTPVAYFDGGNRVLGGMTSGTMYPYYYPKVNSRLTVSSPLELDFHYYMMSAKSGNLFGTIRVDQTMGAGTKRLYYAMVEDPVSTNQRNLARLFYDIEEFTLTDVDDTEAIMKDFTISAYWNEHRIKHIVFVQNISTKEVLQATQAVESPVPAIDVGPTSINSPAGTIPTGIYTVNATISNLGGLDQDDIPVNCTIYNDRMEVVLSLKGLAGHSHFENGPDHPGIYYESTNIVYINDTVVGPIPALDQTNLEFSPDWNAQTPGKYRIVVTTALTDDQSTENNTLVELVEIQ